MGEVHNKRKPGPSETPHWLTIQERGLFTGTAIVGAIGTGKTSCCMYPFAEQILAYRASNKEKTIGGLFLEVKGDFCHKVRDLLKCHDRTENYVEIDLGSEYRYNLLNNNLDAYALAYNIASLLNKSQSDPEIVIQGIADSSVKDKADPNDNARRTVTKAQAQLIQSKCTSSTKRLNPVSESNSVEGFPPERN